MAAIAVLLACAGCSTQADPPAPTTGAVEIPAPSADPSTEPDDDPATPAPTLPTDLPEPLADLVTEPVYPEAAREFTHDGAAAFIQYVIDATNWALVSGDALSLLNYCDDESRYCANVAADADGFDPAIARHGGQAFVEVSEIQINVDEDEAFARAMVLRDAFVDVVEGSGVSNEADATEFHVLFHLAFDANWYLMGAVSE